MGDQEELLTLGHAGLIELQRVALHGNILLDPVERLLQLGQRITGGENGVKNWPLQSRKSGLQAKTLESRKTDCVT